MENSTKIIVGATGASGITILVKCLELIREAKGYSAELIMSRSAELTAEYELGGIENLHQIKELADKVYPVENIAAAPSSGSYQTGGMLIVPCSMKTIAGINSGYSDNLILRAADVTVKEQRKLVLMARESPLSQIHLRNLYELSKIQGVQIIPPMMTFYNNPKGIEDMTYHIASKLLEPFGIEAPLYSRWNG